MSKVDDLARGPWDKIALFHLTQAQAEELLKHDGLFVEKGWLPARYRFPEHAHGEAQMLLVTRGTVTHADGMMQYTQKERDLLVVPAMLKHTAFVGSEELEFYLILKK